MYATITLISIFNSFIVVNSKSVNTPYVCKLEPQLGSCKDSLTRYYFDGSTGKCETFSGCQDNGNNFASIDDCQSMCLTQNFQQLKRSPREVSQEPQQQPLTVSNETITTEPQQSNNTATVTTTTPSSTTSPNVTTVSTVTSSTEPPTPLKTRETVCFQPFAEGNCKENLIRYYYDPEVNKCIKFIFKGCFQYDNNFEKLEDCESLCVLPASTTTPLTS